MTTQKIAAAMHQMKERLQISPEVGLQDDAPATARWESGTRIVSSHSNGTQLSTDMPHALGGSGDQVTPGWLFRAGLASCFATCIAMSAASAGIELTMLEVRATSRSDTRGLLDMADGAGAPVCAGPRDVQLFVKIAAHHVSHDRLRTLVQESYRCSPVPRAVENAVPVTLRIEVHSGCG